MIKDIKLRDIGQKIQMKISIKINIKLMTTNLLKQQLIQKKNNKAKKKCFLTKVKHKFFSIMKNQNKMPIKTEKVC